MIAPEEPVTVTDDERVVEPEESLNRLADALAAARKKFDSDADDWRPELLEAFFSYFIELFTALDIDSSLLDPLMLMLAEAAGELEGKRLNAAGKRKAKIRLPISAALTYLAALTSVLFERGRYSTVETAAKAVAKAAKLDWRRIDKWRNEIHRGKERPEVLRHYEKWKAFFAGLPESRLGLVLRGIEKMGLRNYVK